MKAEDISEVAVIGAGTMGSNIAGELARVGCRVRLMDLDDACLAKGMDLLASAQAALIEAKRLSRRQAQAARKRITLTTSLAEACPGAELMIEAVAEDLPVKRKLYRRLEKLCPAKTIFASNTSGLSITKIAAATKRPGRVAGMHFWNPPHIVPLVEVTMAPATTARTASLLMDVARRLGKQPIRVKHDIPGFVGNRLQFAVLREALHLLESGVASAKDIDTAMTAGPGLRYALLGPLRTADFGGLDIFRAISSYLFADLSAAKGPPAVLTDLVERGRLGAKSGQGFYRHGKEEMATALADRDRALLGILEVLGEGS